MRIRDRIAIITGAGSGIGKAIAIRFAQEGARVVLNDINGPAAQDVATHITRHGGTAFCFEADVSQRDAVEALFRMTAEQYGGAHILVNSAIPSRSQMASNRWDITVSVGLESYWLCMQAAVPLMAKSGSGSIVNISSVNALMGFGNDHVYSAVKAGILGMSRSLVGEVSPRGIRINCICPGSIMTEIWKPIIEGDPTVLQRLSKLYPLGHLGNPEDVANAALFLASDEASFITGAVLAVDGGLTAVNTAFRV